MWLFFATGFFFGWFTKVKSQKDEAKKYGILNISGMKFVRMYSSKEELKSWSQE